MLAKRIIPCLDVTAGRVVKGVNFVALRDAFPSDLHGVAIETIESGLVYTWRDLERATAMLANLLDSLDLPAASRIAVQAEKSVE